LSTAIGQRITHEPLDHFDQTASVEESSDGFSSFTSESVPRGRSVSSSVRRSASGQRSLFEAEARVEQPLAPTFQSAQRVCGPTSPSSVTLTREHSPALGRYLLSGASSFAELQGSFDQAHQVTSQSGHSANDQPPASQSHNRERSRHSNRFVGCHPSIRSESSARFDDTTLSIARATGVSPSVPEALIRERSLQSRYQSCSSVASSSELQPARDPSPSTAFQPAQLRSGGPLAVSFEPLTSDCSQSYERQPVAGHSTICETYAGCNNALSPAVQLPELENGYPSVELSAPTPSASGQPRLGHNAPSLTVVQLRDNDVSSAGLPNSSAPVNRMSLETYPQGHRHSHTPSSDNEQHSALLMSNATPTTDRGDLPHGSTAQSESTSSFTVT
jgi:hypothetical protein